jgi:AcrR family transcriptional regulator
MVQRGVTLLRVADVAREAGVSPGIVHYYFDSKDDLIRETFEDNFSNSLSRRSSIFDRDLPASEKLDLLLRSYVPADEATRESWHVWLELWVGALHDQKLQALNENAYGEWRRLIGGLILEGVESGVFATSDHEADANELVGMMDGLAVQVLLGSSVISEENMYRICARFVRSHLLVV